MGRPKKFENRYEVIVETADRLFMQKGFAGTTMDEIAKECNLGKASLYAEFESKEALMSAVISRFARNYLVSMREKIEQAQGRYLETLESILLDRVLLVYDHATKHFSSVEVLMSASNHGFQDAVQGYRDEEYHLLGGLLEKAAANGEIRPRAHYYRTAKMIRKGMVGLYPPNIFNIEREELRQDAQEIVSMLLAGLKIQDA